MHRLFNLCHFLLLRLLRLVFRHPKKILVLTVISSAFFATQMPHLKALLSFNDYLDDSYPVVERFMDLREEFDLGNSAVILFTPVEKNFTQGDVCRIDKWIRQQALVNEEILRISSPLEIRSAEKIGKKVLYPATIQLNCTNPKLKDEPISFTALKQTPFSDTVTDRNSRDILVELMLRDSVGGSKVGRFDPKPVGVLIENLEDTFKSHDNIIYRVSGGAAFQWYYLLGLKIDRRLNVLAVLIIPILFRIFLGSWVGGALLISTLMIMATIVFGSMAILRQPIDLLSNSLFLLVSVSAVQDFLFMSYYQAKHGRKKWKTVFSRFVAPSLLTSITSIIGFGSLYASDLEIIQKFGLWAAFGATVEWIMIFVFLPALMTKFPRLRQWTNSDKALSLGSFAKLSDKSLPPLLARGLVCLLPFGFLGVFNLNISDDPNAIFPKHHEFRQTNDLLKDTRRWHSLVYLAFKDKDSKEFNRSILEKVKKEPGVVTVTDPYKFDAFVTGYLKGPIGDMVRSEVSQSDGYKRYFSENKALAVVYLKDTKTTSIKHLRNFEKQHCPRGKCYFAGEMVSYDEFSGQIVPSLLASFIISLVLVGIVLICVCLSFKRSRVASILSSALFGAVMMIGIISLFQIPINFVTCIFAAVLVGIAGDNAIQYLFASRRSSLQESSRQRGAASILITLVMMSSTGVLAFAAFVPPRILALLFGWGFFMNLVGDLWLLRGLRRDETSPT